MSPMCVHSIDFPVPLINMHNSLIITENCNLPQYDGQANRLYERQC